VKAKAAIFDLDGTLADLNGRSPYDDGQELCEQDLLHEHIAELARMYHNNGYAVLVVSGRYRRFIQPTMRWLNAHRIPFYGIWMRPNFMVNEKGKITPNYESDTVIKERIYREEIEPHFDVKMVYDDRPKVIRMWRELGLNVADVGKGIEF
jgi:hydroxymethylpyrimidine pyrophosphatase-like HAD family hydrolase